MTVRNLLLAAGMGTSALAPAAIGAPGIDIPPRQLTAYEQAASGPDTCPGLDWPVIAAIFARESNHGRYAGATISPDGIVSPPIRNGSSGAMGPGQFLPSSWVLFGAGGNPDDIDDAARATARHLCGTFGDLQGDHLRGAIAAYYGADVDGYADAVLANVAAYRAAPAHAQVTTAAQDGITLRVTDELLWRTYEGWSLLADRVKGQSPDAAPVIVAASAAIDDLVLPDSAPAASTPSAPAGPAIGGVVCPVTGTHYVLSGWGSPRSGGRTHQGADLAGTYGSPVVAPFDGRVVQVDNDPATAGLGGLAVWIEATDGPYRGVWVYLAHNKANTVRVGDQVRQGQTVAVLGDTGNAAGTDTPHVHAQWHPAGGGPAPATPLETACQENQP